MEYSKGSCDHAALMCEIKALREEKQRLEDQLAAGYIDGFDYRHKADVDYIYFLNDPKNKGLIFFKSIKERHRHARAVIRGYLDSNKLWTGDVYSVVTGVVSHLITEYNTTVEDDFKRCDYKLTPVEIVKDELLEDMVSNPLENHTKNSETT